MDYAKRIIEQMKEALPVEYAKEMGFYEGGEYRDTGVRVTQEYVTTRVEELEKALKACVESLHVVERDILPLWETAKAQGLKVSPEVTAIMPLRFAEWSHPANSLRMAEQAVASPVAVQP